MEKKYNACLYLRLSHEDCNNAESDSIHNQKCMLSKFVNDSPDIELVNVRTDDGYSGSNFDRPAFKQMLQDIYDNTINCVIVKDFSRLGRDYIETNRYLHEIFPSMGVRFISLNENYDTNNKDNSNKEDVMNFLSIFNDNYCRDISMKTRSSFEIKRKTGNLAINNVPYGYKKVDREIQVDEEVRQNVVDIFNYKIQGYNQQQIANIMNENGVLSPFEYSKKQVDGNANAVLWSSKTIKRMLVNEFYIGNLCFGKTTKKNYKSKTITDVPKEQWSITEDNHESIVDKSTFMLVNSLLSQDNRISLDTQRVNIFSGIAFCSDCGATLVKTSTSKNGKSYDYYMCGANKSEKCCLPHRISCHDLYDIVLESIKNYIENCRKEFDGIVDVVTSYSSNKNEELQEELAECEIELKNIEKNKNSLDNELKNKIINKQDYIQLRNFYDKKISELNTKQQQLEYNIITTINSSINVDSFIECIKEHKTITFLTRVLVLNLIDKIIVYNTKEIEIFYKFQHFQHKGVESDG